MKTAATVIVLVVMPLGFFFLAAIIVNRMLAKRRQRLTAATKPMRCQTPHSAQSLVSRFLTSWRSVLSPYGEPGSVPRSRRTTLGRTA